MTQFCHQYVSTRERQVRASKGPSNTFICCNCHQFRGMAGKKFSHMEGRRQRFKCAVCVGEGK